MHTQKYSRNLEHVFKLGVYKKCLKKCLKTCHTQLASVLNYNPHKSTLQVHLSLSV